MTSTRSPIARGAAVFAAAVTLAACGSSTASDAESDTTVAEGTDTEAAVSGDSTSGQAGVEAALWGDNVSVEIGTDSWNFVSDGLPNHEIPDQFLVPTTGSFTPPVSEDETEATDSSIAVIETPLDVDIPLYPVYSDTVTETDLGIIGVMISGAQMFNDYEDTDRAFVAVDDNFTVDGVSFVDSCNGHPLALLADGTGQGNYHYHGIPYCITDAVDVDGEHSTVIGFLLDGFPIYGNKGEGGETVTSADLDECSGHVEATPEYPDGIYHYHLTEDESPYTVDCYHGEIDSSANSDTGGGGGAPADGEGPPPGDQ